MQHILFPMEKILVCKESSCGANKKQLFSQKKNYTNDFVVNIRSNILFISNMLSESLCFQEKCIYNALFYCICLIAENPWCLPHFPAKFTF